MSSYLTNPGKHYVDILKNKYSKWLFDSSDCFDYLSRISPVRYTSRRWKRPRRDLLWETEGNINSPPHTTNMSNSHRNKEKEIAAKRLASIRGG